MRLPDFSLVNAPSGRGTPATAALTELRDFGPNPGALRMFFHVPDGLPKSAPLVVILHGCGQNAAGYDHGTGWSALGAQQGFAVLAPEQQSANNMGGCFNWFRPGDTMPGEGEAASIRQMIARMIADHQLDPARVYVTGLSAGGAMAAAMLAAYPQVFAGGAVIAGLAYGAAANVSEALTAMRHAPARTNAEWGAAVRKASSHAGPWPALSVWHGDADATVHVSNAEALIAQWSDLLGLAKKPAHSETGANHVRRSWQGADGRPVLESYTIAGMAHGAPIVTQTGGHAGPFFLESELSSTLAIADFWGLKQQPAARTAAPKRPVVEKSVTAKIATPVVEKPPQQTVAARRSTHKAAGLRATLVRALKNAGLIR